MHQIDAPKTMAAMQRYASLLKLEEPERLQRQDELVEALTALNDCLPDLERQEIQDFCQAACQACRDTIRASNVS